MFRPLWIEVDLKALRHNFKTIKKIVSSKTKIVATVKQYAYGHGLVPVARELSRLGVNSFGVGSIEEAITLRDNGFTEPILVLTTVFARYAHNFIKYQITPTVVDIKFARKLNKEALDRDIIFPIHVKIDTGMGRLGVHYEDAHEFIKKLRKLKNITLEGIFTHFPVADTDPEFTNSQIDIFNKFIARLHREGITFKYCHSANSIGLINYPSSHFNMVRPGLILYGIKPLADIDSKLEPVLTLKSRIVFIKKIKKGTSVSYGRIYIAEKPTLIATIAIGYADGYPWALSNCSKVIIRDRIFNVVGKVCMDHIMVDLEDRIDIKIGQEVILLGRSKNVEIAAEDLASWAKTIPYEIVSRLSLKIPRIYKNPTQNSHSA
ncbi:MAG: alanine racemase [Candidatus Omnitrophota bacterium]|nr:alanine racemase [Candidatus Omnitrophota bacterium]